jgi:hypothetical protein
LSGFGDAEYPAPVGTQEIAPGATVVLKLNVALELAGDDPTTYPGNVSVPGLLPGVMTATAAAGQVTVDVRLGGFGPGVAV